MKQLEIDLRRSLRKSGFKGKKLEEALYNPVSSLSVEKVVEVIKKNAKGRK
mgnify:CR=1 FL=1